MKAWALYSVARLTVFAAACVVVWLLLGPLWDRLWWLGVICAAIIAYCISYLFFGRLKAQVVADLAARAEGRLKAAADVDAQAEDLD